MTPERFKGLAEAYGGEVVRWPVDERDAAAALVAAQPAWARAVLAEAMALDDVLAAYAAPRATTDLVGRIVAGAPHAQPRWRRWVLPAGLGAGLAAACAAGVVLGVRLETQSGMPAAGVSDAEALVTAVSDDELGLYLDDDA